MKQMTVRETAYNETYEWLLDDKEGAKPRPPEGMHALALNEWMAGQAAAINDFDVDDEKFEGVVELTVCVVKVAIIYGIFSVGTYIGVWWSMAASVLVGLAFAWKFMSKRHE